MPRSSLLPVQLLLALCCWTSAGLVTAAAATLTINDVTERELDGAPALAVVLSAALAGDRSYDDYLAVSRAGQAVNGAWVLGERGQILYFPGVAPETTYQVLVRAGLPAANGALLAEAVRQSVTTRPLPPAVRFLGDGNILPTRLGGGLPLEVINVPAVDVEILRVKPTELPRVSRYLLTASQANRWRLARLHEAFTSVFLGRFQTQAEPNRRTRLQLPVQQLAALAEPGVYLAVVEPAGQFRNAKQTSLFLISDLGLHIRDYGGHLRAIAATLGDGRPVADVAVTLYNRKGEVLQRVTTNGEGVADLFTAAGDKALLFAQTGRQIAFVDLRRPALDLSAFEVSGRPYRPLEVFGWLPRDLYRPGEAVPLHLLLRDADGRAVTRMPLDVRVQRADGREHSRLSIPAGELGHYQQTIELPADAPTGQWNIAVRTDPGAAAVNRLTFHVEEFLPERLKLILDSPQAVLAPGDTWQIAVDGDYLYGAPAAGNRLEARVYYSAQPQPLQALGEFYFGDATAEATAWRTVFDGALDDKGRQSLTVDLAAEPPVAPRRVLLKASLYETGGRAVHRLIERTLWPAPAMVGVRPLFSDDRPDPNAPARFAIVKANPQGELLAGAGLEVQLIFEDRHYHWRYSEEQGWRLDYDQVEYPVHNQMLNLAAGERAELALPVERGRYRLEIYDPATELTTRYRFQAGYGRQDANTAAPDKVNLSLDRAAYRGGDTAQLTIKPPHAGQAIVMVEADQPLWQVQTTVPAAGKTLDVPINPGWQRHDLYIAVVVLRGVSRATRIAPNRAVGIIPLHLERSDRELQVAIDAPAHIKPQQTLPVRLQVADASEGPVRLTLAAVDVGALNITGFATPDPHAWFFAQRAYQPGLHDVYGRIIESWAADAPSLRYGGGADAFARSRRADAEVQIVSLMQGPVAVDSNGEALVELPIPDFNGELRLMALAFGASRYGANEQALQVRSPLVAELSRPRFLGSGDRARVALDLHNLSGTAQAFQLDLTATSPVSLEAAPASLRLADGERRTLRFPLTAAQALGVGSIALTISGDDLELTRQWELAVRPPYPGDLRQQRGTIIAGEQFTMPKAMAAGLMPATVRGELSLAARPPLNLAAALEHLLGYPYGCAEQTTSKALPLVYADPVALAKLGIEPLSAAEREQRIHTAIERLAGMQRPAGGFSLWSGDGPADLWLSAYVTDFLTRARERGYGVPQTMLKQALARLEALLQTAPGFSVRAQASAYRFASRAYAAQILARQQRASLGSLRVLYDHHREEALAGLPLVRLGLALQAAGDHRRAEAAIALGLERKRQDAQYIGDYGSPLRDMAWKLALLAEADVASADINALYLQLAEQLHGRQWLSTQERNALFLAGLHLPDSDTPWVAELQLGDKHRTLGGTGSKRVALNAAQLSSGVSVATAGDQPLFYELRVAGYPTEAPAADSTAARIERRYLDLDGQPRNINKLTVGEQIIVHTRIEPEIAMPNGLLVDLLPAGLEIDNPNLGDLSALAELDIEGQTLGERLQPAELQHAEYRDDRYVAAVDLDTQGTTHLVYVLRAVTPGEYTWSAPSLEDMYLPERRAQGADTRHIRVIAP